MSSPPPSSDVALTAAELEGRLDALLNPVLSPRRTSRPLADALAGAGALQQQAALQWTDVLTRTNHELAYQFAAVAPDAMARLDARTAEAWIVHALDVYDREGLARGISALRDFAGFVPVEPSAAATVTLDEVKAVLELFLCGLSGRRLRLASGSDAHTDTETVFLPPAMAQFGMRAQNFLAYKGLATHLWAQARYGTFNAGAQKALAAYADPARATALFQLLEAIRLDAILGRELPGLARELIALRGDRPLPHPACAALTRPDATAADSLSVLAQLYAELSPDHWFWMGALHLDQAQQVRDLRIEHEKTALQEALGELAQALPPATDAQTADGGQAPHFSRQSPADDTPRATDPDARYRLQRGGAQMRPPDSVMLLLDSIEQDLGGVPDDYFQPGPDDYRPDRLGTTDAIEPEPEFKPARGANIYAYDEWDYQRRHYRKNWCVLREQDVRPADDDFVDATRRKYAPQVAQLKRTFESLRGEDKLLRAQPDGDDVDLDAVVAGYVDLRTGAELPDRLQVKRRKAERDMAVMFMVDMSGSTKGWINDAEREALVLFCEAIEVLGDRYAIYGFSGVTRQRCDIYRIKRFEDTYDAVVRGRIAGITPQDYTRMGAAIRHLTMLLDRVEARTKLLVTLSDGKPDDYSDHYRGEYGIEDTRQALAEAHRKGIHPFCITIDKEARDYLPHMYGAVNWALVEDVTRLPLKVADIYRRLTT